MDSSAWTPSISTANLGQWVPRDSGVFKYVLTEQLPASPEQRDQLPILNVWLYPQGTSGDCAVTSLSPKQWEEVKFLRPRAPNSPLLRRQRRFSRVVSPSTYGAPELAAAECLSPLCSASPLHPMKSPVNQSPLAPHPWTRTGLTQRPRSLSPVALPLRRNRRLLL